MSAAEQVWFGDADRPLAGLLHQGSTAAVLICPPLGRELLLAYSELKRLAEALSAEGYTVLRLDYDGSGNSDGGMGDPARVEAWTGSIHAGAAFLREHGASTISLVGLRMGALLASRAVDGLGAVDALVLWDPQSSGRAFLRQQAMLAQLVSKGAPSTADGSVHVFGAVFPTDTAAAVSALRLTAPADADVKRVLVLHRPGDEGAYAAFESADLLCASEQEELLEVDPPAPTPSTRAAIVDWMGPADAPRLPAVATGWGIVHDRSRRPVRERAWRSASGRLFGIVSEPAAQTPAGGAPVPAVLLLTAGTWHHVGLGRLWVDLARQCAAEGVRVLRVDLSGLGESDVREGQAAGVVYAEKAVDDVLEAARELDDGSGVRLVGHCSGGWLALRAAESLRPASVHAIGVPGYPDIAAFRAPATREGVTVGTPRQRFFSWLLATLQRPGIERWRTSVPQPVWRALDALRVVPGPWRILQRLLDAGVSVHLFADEMDSVWWRAEGRHWLEPARLREDFTATPLPLVDHQFATALCRQVVASALMAQLTPAAAVPSDLSGT